MFHFSFVFTVSPTHRPPHRKRSRLTNSGIIYLRIYKLVHQVVRASSIGIRKNYKRKELKAVREGAGDNEMEIIHDGQYDGMDADDTDVTWIHVPVAVSRAERWIPFV